jgi:MFS family permease
MLFIASCFSYGDRVALAIAGAAMEKELALDPVKLGFLLSGFSWAYVAGQLPSGGLLDRFGSKRVYGISIVCWSVCAFLVGFTGHLTAAWVFTAIFILRLLSGLAQSPVFPGNGRIVAAWFPTAERGGASAIFNASQYFALVAFAPLFGWFTHTYGWRSCFWFMGFFGLLLAFVWSKAVYNAKDHPLISRSEIECIERGGGLVNIDRVAGAKSRSNSLTWTGVSQLLKQRMLVGIYIGQFCITTLTYFFITWFPVYLVQARHMSILKGGLAAALPALCGSVGRTGRRLFRRASSPRALPHLCAQGANHRGDAAFRDDDRVQLHQRAGADDVPDVAGVLWERLWRAGLDGDCGHVAEGVDRAEWRIVQPVRQHRRHHDADRDWVPGKKDGLVQRCADLRRRNGAAGHLQLCGDCWRDQAARACSRRTGSGPLIRARTRSAPLPYHGLCGGFGSGFDLRRGVPG